jgi:porin
MKHSCFIVATALIAGHSLFATPYAWARAQDTAATQDTTRRRANLAGPDQVDNQLQSDARPKESLLQLGFLDSYFEFKDRLKEETGLGFGVDYSTVYMKASASLAEEEAWSGMLRLYGSWELVGRGSGNSGSFVFKVEHRHRYLAIAPKVLSFNIGYAGIFAAPFSDEKLRWTNLYWLQRLGGGRFVFLAGFLDATDFFDVYAMASPWLHFTNLAFSTGSAATALPNDGLLGAAVGAWISDQVYALASVGDNGSDPTDPFSGFDRFVNVNEYFTSLEVGWTTGKSRAYFDNVHVSLWHSDQKTEIGDPAGWGVNVSATKYIDDTWLPFVRGGYTEDGGSLLQKSLSLGLGYQPVQYGNLLGLGVNWGEPNATTWGSSDLPDQYSFELFYRWQLGERFAVTPDLQYFIDPALNPDQSSIWLFGLRARLAL